MENFRITTDKNLIGAELLMQNEPSLPEAMRQLNLCEAFAGVLGEKTVCACLLQKRKGYFEVINLALDEGHTHTGADKEVLFYTLDYVRAQGGAIVEIGAGSADFSRHQMLIETGFRVVGVWRDHFAANAGAAKKTGKAHNPDMLRYRIDMRNM